MDIKRFGAEFVDSLERAGQYAIDVDGELVPLLALPPGAVGKIQDRTGLRWQTIMVDPLYRIDVAESLVQAAYNKLGKPAPGFGGGDEVVRLFVEMPADLPDPEPEQGDGENPTTAS